MRRADGRILKDDTLFDQGGAVVKVDRYHRHLVFHQDAVRLLKVGRPRDLVRLRQRHADQLAVASVVPAGVLPVGIGVEYSIQDVVEVRIVHAPSHPVSVVRARARIVVAATEKAIVVAPIVVDRGDGDVQVIPPLLSHRINGAFVARGSP